MIELIMKGDEEQAKTRQTKGYRWTREGVDPSTRQATGAESVRKGRRECHH